MNILLWLLLGALAGWLAGVFMKSDHSTVEDIILGIVGSFVGGFIMNFFGQSGVTGFNLYSVIVSTIGAVCVIFLGRVLRR
ncbi:MAG: GlsB/YeaQ/YmgE family stress response membrane protein [Candidatus Pacebacteria bacterium CG10_big_fil_rev_8_21_14_0_10_36_11]|nr:GlsB/YeaQ/YmgE family stress response membrane protein [Candidatus Pacearchaeota archaeon]OIP73657.1 MAG: hypothetical protein AUK08_03770 [Candidatus Pacebacteria bacterium CG2_30_36_39]PIR64761.1 MAG: GlsB/YeaQ/YmgE family stress response membrane protein [Candidatus Pacebacteria bacterium CG10_big_fil_rev_8_21_14_0_10_36_11]PJC42325.1 MAG: GlsB/YeaQ/YmgE family stress response membrane protein [Candidatus Pacebacteria bacterium CG_4_9_14_0_2_um_filter_36_8]